MDAFLHKMGLFFLIKNSSQNKLANILHVLESQLQDSDIQQTNETYDLKNKDKNCSMPTKDNGCMNFIFGDPANKPPACKVNSTNCNQRFFRNPVTTVKNNQHKFALSLYGKMGQCKAFGKGCGNNIK